MIELDVYQDGECCKNETRPLSTANGGRGGGPTSGVSERTSSIILMVRKAANMMMMVQLVALGPHTQLSHRKGIDVWRAW